MIGMLGQMLAQFVQSNPAMVGHALAVAGNEVAQTKKRKLDAEEAQIARQKQEEEAIAQHKAEIYDFAIRCEVESLTETDERYKKYDADVLREFAEKRLLENLPARIESWNGEIAERSGEIDSENAIVRNLQEQLAEQNRSEKDFEDAMNEYQDRCNEANRLNEFYRIFVSASDDDFGQLEIMSAVKRFSISESELLAIKKFAKKNSLAKDVEFMKMPSKPKKQRSAKSASMASLKKEIGKHKKIIDEDQKSIALIEDLVGVMREFVDDADETAESSDGSRSEDGEVEDEGAEVESEEISSSESEISDATEVTDAVSEIYSWFEGSKGLEGVFLCEEIPDDKLANACESMKVREASVVVLIDTTVFGSAKDGIVVTESAVYLKDMWEAPKRFTWRQLKTAKIRGDGDVLKINRFEFNGMTDEGLVDAIAQSLSEIAKRLG